MKYLFVLFFFTSIIHLSMAQDTEWISKAQAAMQSGDLDAALSDLEQCKNQEAPIFLNTYGELLLRQGKNDKSITYLKSALDKNISLGNELGQAQSYNNLGVVYWNTGNKSLALEYFTEALDLRKKHLDPSDPLIADCNNNIGLLYISEDPSKAGEYYKRSLDVYQTYYGVNHAKTALAHINIALAFQGQQLPDFALSEMQKALEIYETLEPGETPNKAFVYSAMGKIDVDKEAYSEALKLQDRALKVYQLRFGNKHPEVANTYNLIGQIYNRQGELEKALNTYQLAICANMPDYNVKDPYFNPSQLKYYNADILLSSLLFKAQAFEALHFTETLKARDLDAELSALGVCDKLVEDIRRTRINESDKIALGNIASQVYEHGLLASSVLANASLCKKRDAYMELAFRFTEKNKSAVLLQAIADTRAKEFAGIPEDVLAQEEDLKVEIAYLEQKLAEAPGDNEMALRQSLFDKKREYEVFLKKLETDFQSYYELKYNSALPNIEDIKNQLQDGELLLSYFVAWELKRLFVFYIDQKKAKLFEVGLPDDFHKQITALKNSILYQEPTIFAEESHSLHKLIFPKPLNGFPGSLFKQTNRLIIIPDEQLSTIPFEVLTTKKVKEDFDFATFPYLVLDQAVSYYYSTSLFWQLRFQGNRITEGQEMLICAPVEFSATHQLNDLPGTAKEVAEIETLLVSQGKKVQSFTHEEANESLIKDEDLSNFSYIHLATHGVVDETQPALSCIYFSPIAGDTNEGRLYSGEIYSLKLGADLVTLSACETGLGKLTKGEGIIGLTRAILFAGAKNIMVSQWSVSDASTAELMVEFYKQLPLQNDQYAFSLQAAKKRLIAEKEFSSPFYWAPFILLGY